MSTDEPMRAGSTGRADCPACRRTHGGVYCLPQSCPRLAGPPVDDYTAAVDRLMATHPASPYPEVAAAVNDEVMGTLLRDQVTSAICPGPDCEDHDACRAGADVVMRAPVVRHLLDTHAAAACARAAAFARQHPDLAHRNPAPPEETDQ